jgi:hypothetical protein
VRILPRIVALALGEDETNIGAQVTDFGHELIEPPGHAFAVMLVPLSLAGLRCC